MICFQTLIYVILIYLKVSECTLTMDEQNLNSLEDHLTKDLEEIADTLEKETGMVLFL